MGAAFQHFAREVFWILQEVDWGLPRNTHNNRDRIVNRSIAVSQHLGGWELQVAPALALALEQGVSKWIRHVRFSELPLDLPAYLPTSRGGRWRSSRAYCYCYRVSDSNIKILPIILSDLPFALQLGLPFPLSIPHPTIYVDFHLTFPIPSHLLFHSIPSRRQASERPDCEYLESCVKKGVRGASRFVKKSEKVRRGLRTTDGTPTPAPAPAPRNFPGTSATPPGNLHLHVHGRLHVHPSTSEICCGTQPRNLR